MSPGTSLQASGPVYGGDAQTAGPWYRQISPEQWRAFWATFLRWVVDAFDFNILAFILIDIQKSFSVDRALAWHWEPSLSRCVLWVASLRAQPPTRVIMIRLGPETRGRNFSEALSNSRQRARSESRVKGYAELRLAVEGELYGR